MDKLDQQETFPLADMLVWDNHGCMPLRPRDESFLPQLWRYKQSGVDVASINVGFDAVPWENTVQMAAQLRRWLKQHGDRYIQVESVADIHRARAEHKLGVIFDIEGACSLNGLLPMVELYYDLGVRWMLIAYNLNNDVGGGCKDDDQGLTPFGRDVICEMERVGMGVCCSHTGLKTALEVMEMAAKPVIFSHSNPRALKDHRRNITDQAIRACAATGGVVGINGIGDFLGDNDNSTGTFVRHIDYVAQLVGTDHVGIGIDYVFDMAEMEEYLRANSNFFPAADNYAQEQKIVAPEQMPEAAELLQKMGYGDEDLRKIMGGNHLRVAEQVWR